MKVADLTELAARNLREALLRNSLTTMGIAVGVASLIAMLSLGVGLQRLFTQRLESSGLFDSVVVRPRPNLAGMRPTAGQRLSGDLPPQTPAHPLDEAARAELARLPAVVEVYPDLRFTGDVRFGTNGQVTQIASLPPSASSEDAFEDMQGHFFASPQAHQVILQTDLANDLAESEHLQPADLIGREIVLRYAGRQPLDTHDPDPATDAGADSATRTARRGEPGPEEAALGFSVISSQILLRVAGIVDAESVPTGALGFGRAGAYVPVAVAESMGVVQGNDMSEVIRSAVEGGGNRYANLTVRMRRPADVAAAEDSIKGMGFATFSLLDVTRNLQRAFAVLDLLLGIFGSLALAVASLGIVNTLVMSILRAAPRNWRLQGSGRFRPRRSPAFLRGSGGHGSSRRGHGRGTRLGDRPFHPVRHQRLSAPSRCPRRAHLDLASLANRRGHRLFHRGEPRGGHLSGGARRQTGPGRGAAL